MDRTKRFFKAVIIVSFMATLLASPSCSRAEETKQANAEPAPAVNVLPKPDDEKELEYTVCADTLYLRAQPSSAAKILAVLNTSTIVRSYRNDCESDENAVYWQKVKVDGIEGWAVGKYLIPTYIYDAYREADRLGKAGDTSGMIAAIKAANRTFSKDGSSWGDIRHSPDGRKMFEYKPQDIRFSDYSPAVDFCWLGIFYFETGKGLVQRWDLEMDGVWSPDSRYYICTEYVRLGAAPLYLLDTSTDEEKLLGYVKGNIEYLKGYFIWLDFKPTDQYGEPRLAAYELATGNTIFLLKADPATLKKAEHPELEVKLVPADPIPPKLILPPL